ncbi:protein-disulfide reductase DsbD family protein [Alphaproteobacteria bacterium]|nr:protein-disulfide reductase DsbD family protein [Alphaproteobacteria bacterium]
MYNHVMNLNLKKTVIIFLSFVFFYIVNLGICYSNTLLQNKFLDKNESYDFVKFDLLFGKKYDQEPSKILLGLKVTLLPKWKIYWRNPGDAGLPPEINIKSANNIKSVDLLFPSPKRFNFYDIETFGYDEEIIFPLIIKSLDNSKSISGILEFNAQVCSEICVPVNHKFNLLNFNYTNNVSSSLEDILSYNSTVPKLLKNNQLKLLSTIIEDNKLKFNFLNDVNIKPTDIIIEDMEGNIYQKPIYSIKNKTLEVVIDINTSKVDYLNKYTKLTFITNDVSYERVIKDLKIIENNNQDKKINPNSYFGFEIILIAFLGGLILNFMPCVLPILSLKMVQLVSYRTLNKYIYRNKIFFNILGILTTFLLFAITAHLIKTAGNIVGWGIQFQNSYFVFFMIMLTLFFSLNLFGFFQYFIPSKILTILSYKKEGLLGDFLTGMFLTLLATPCTAPFVGTAIGFALSGSTLEIYTILLIMGIGLSTPLILILIFPAIISLLPKPGNWLIIFKKIMGLLLLLTTLWLTSIFLELNNNNNKIIKNFNDSELIINWNIKNNINLPNELVKQGNIVFIDITADWCLTCLVNKNLVLDTEEVTKLFKKYNVVTLRLDWTKPNGDIKKFLVKNGRFGIPFNKIYGPLIPNGRILPELLSVKLIREYIETAK